MDLTDQPAGSTTPRNQGGEAMLARALGRARWSIFWERLWPVVAGLATVAGLFLAVSWLGLWVSIPPLGRAIGLGVFFLLAAAAFAPLFAVRIPTANDGLRRLDRNSGRQHRPATAIADDIATPSEDAFALALWRAHVKRALLSARTLKAGVPSPRVALRDPFALRALVAVLVVATFIAAGGDRGKRIAAAFDWHGVIAPANFRVDAWVSPPPYTGRAPVILPGLRPGEPVPATVTMAVPAGSTLVIRSTGQVQLNVVTHGGLAEPAQNAHTASANGTEERRFVINDAGSASVRGAVASDVTWRFTAIPDKPPTIAFAKDPESQQRGNLQMTYKLEDDYGVVGAQATFRTQNAAGVNGQPPRPLFEAPDFALTLPQARTKNGVGQTVKDLTEHPWAGVDVEIVLTARDEAGNEGRSAPVEYRLPERPFGKPIARALIEQRRILALNADAQAMVLTALDALTFAPEKFQMERNVYLGLRTIFWQLARAKSDDQMRDVVARMWDMAVNLEDGNVSDAEAALRAAQKALEEALKRVPPEELRDLLRKQEELRDRTAKQDQDMKQRPQPLDPLGQDEKKLQEQTENLQKDNGALDELTKNQQALRDQLKKLLQDELKRNDDERSALNRGDDAMRDAHDGLRDRKTDSALDAQQRAIDALKDALAKGPTDAELKQLMDQLREAMNKYLQALAEQLRKNPQQLARPLDPNARQLRPQDLRSMLDRMEQMARNGQKDAARRMLQELQQMLENLQMARPGQQMDGDSDDDMMQALDELGDVIRKQQQLRDRTFQQGQDMRRGQRGQRGQQGQQGQQGQGEQQMGDLQQEQQQLREQLKKLMEELRKRGFGQGQQGQGKDPLGEAGEQMGEAEGRLGQNNADGAVDSQGKALDALRRGAQSLAQQMQQQGMGMGPGPGQPGGRMGQPRAQQETDPLGRPLRGRDYGDDSTVKVPGEIDAQRARRIIEELRRRFGEAFRPQLELDYIERLLKDY
jgi:hypothetical protein